MWLLWCLQFKGEPNQTVNQSSVALCILLSSLKRYGIASDRLQSSDVICVDYKSCYLSNVLRHEFLIVGGFSITGSPLLLKVQPSSVNISNSFVMAPSLPSNSSNSTYRAGDSISLLINLLVSGHWQADIHVHKLNICWKSLLASWK